MNRRELITLLGGIATWPLAARAQQDVRARRIGIVSGFTELEMQPLLGAFREQLKVQGWVESQNLVIDVRLSGANFDRMKDDAGALLTLNPDLIIAQGTPGVTAVRQNSRTVPVVFVLVADPVQQGFIESLAHPGGNTTGFTNFQFSIGGKWLDLLRQVDQRIKHVTLISDPLNPNAGLFSAFIENAGRLVSLEITTAQVTNPSEIQAAIDQAATQPGGSLIVVPDSLTTIHRHIIIDLAGRNRLPAIYPFRIFSTDGGLISYGLDFPQLYRDAATYADRILRGEKPADLPVQAPSKFELVINLKAAKTLGLAIPQSLLVAADEVIE
jgi:putative ABC transport system substrate-binding protein